VCGARNQRETMTRRGGAIIFNSPLPDPSRPEFR
jgi:hypothetical protein